MNLVSDGWVPVLNSRGNVEKIGLLELFINGSKYLDFVVYPAERVSILRFLCCLLYRAGNDIISYLEKWKKNFNLFGKRPFLQISDLEAEEKNKSTWEHLSPLFPTGNQSVLFTPSTKLAVEDLPLTLLTALNFGLGGTSPIAVWNGVSTLRSLKAAPCSGSKLHTVIRKKNIKKTSGSKLHTVIRKKNIKETIRANMLPIDQLRAFSYPLKMGVPVWEKMPKSLDDEESIKNATHTILGRLCPLSRLIRLFEDGTMFFGGRTDIFDFGSYQELTETKIRTKKGWIPLIAKEGRDIWRDLNAITSKREREGGGIPILQNIEEQNVDIMVCAIHSFKGKYIDYIESNYFLSHNFIEDQGREKFETCTKYAEDVEKRLYKAMKEYFHILVKFKEISGDVRKMRTYFWTGIQMNLFLIWEVINTPVEKFEEKYSQWCKKVNLIAYEVYNECCSSGANRHYPAYVTGLKILKGDKK